MQPSFLPWLGFFDLIRKADVFVIYDHVQFEKQSWQQRNRIRNKQGEIMLIMPVRHNDGLKRRIKDVEIDFSRDIFRKHLNSIQLSYSKAKNFDIVYPSLETIYLKRYKYLIDLNISLIKLGMEFLSINKEFRFSSEMDVQGCKVEALIDVCKKVNADHYLSPRGSKQYIDKNNLFPSYNIQLEYQSFNHPVYMQVNYGDFISHLSFIDYLFNVEIEKAQSFGLD